MTKEELETFVVEKNREYQSKIDEAFKLKREEVSPPFFSYLIENFPPDLPFECFILLGKTPDWNDGEPCYHSQTIKYYDDELEKFYRDRGVKTELESPCVWTAEYLEILKRHPQDYSEVRSLDTFLNSFEDLLHLALGTNWAFLFEKKNGTWTYELVDATLFP